jgi:hypothetical protein
MKKIFILLFVIFPILCFSQITGKYQAYQYIPLSDTVVASAAYPIEIGGDNYSWILSAAWADTSVLTTSTIRPQISPDGVKWMDYEACDTMRLSSYSFYLDNKLLSKWIRLSVSVTSGDTIYNFKGWYEFKNNK